MQVKEDKLVRLQDIIQVESHVQNALASQQADEPAEHPNGPTFSHNCFLALSDAGGVQHHQYQAFHQTSRQSCVVGRYPVLQLGIARKPSKSLFMRQCWADDVALRCVHQSHAKLKTEA